MRIGIDATELFGEATGVGRYLAELLIQWTGGATSHELILYAPSALEASREDLPHLNEGTSALRFVFPAGRPGMRWQQGALRRSLRRDPPDVFLAPAYTAPLGCDVPVVLALHDVSFVAHPEWFPWRHGLKLRRLARLSALAAVEVLTLSNFSKQEIVEHLGLAPDRVRIVRPGVSLRFRPPVDEVPREPLVLFVGTLLNRRHPLELVDAFGELARRRPDARLVIVGANRTEPRQDPAARAAAVGLADRVEVTSYVTDHRLGELYGRAGAFAFLSSYEGFALTPMEALSMGVPAVLLDTPVAREVYGDAALYAREGDLEDTAAALERLLYEPDTRDQLLGRATALLAEHTWARTATLVMDALERAAR